MKSYQNLVLLKSLYRDKALGFSFMDPLSVNEERQSFDLSLPTDLNTLHSQMAQCHLCDLSKHRQRVLTGFGNINAKLMFIDSSPSMVEDESGDSFAGRSGSSFEKMITQVLKLKLEDIYLTHSLKCRPSHNHIVLDSELSSCKPYLFKQIELVNPDIIVTLGELAYNSLIKDENNFEKIRGQKIPYEGRTLIPLYHPSHLLRNPSLKKCTMDDLMNIKGLL
ncbi:uracil-DNA glycosylase [Sulfurimonas sp. MAG313]|nr:uracil-DNA glycosylase [Sulfurimonas sp. MAG313]MDF1881366.1 uracil-DNA glycosylase [Sulfurimonas sp. MAG313]